MTAKQILDRLSTENNPPVFNRHLKPLIGFSLLPVSFGLSPIVLRYGDDNGLCWTLDELYHALTTVANDTPTNVENIIYHNTATESWIEITETA